MGALFSSGCTSPKAQRSDSVRKSDQITDKDRAILDLKNARDRLKRYRKKLEADSERLTEQAKELIKKKQKERALLTLKFRRFKDKEVSNVDGQLLSVLEMIENVEWEHANMEVLKALKSGTSALNKLHEEMSVDDVANLLDDTNEAIEVENQINAMLTGQLTMIDDEELQKELDDIMGEATSNVGSSKAVADIAQTPAVTTTLPEAPNTPVLPVAPKGDIVVDQKEEEKLANMKANPLVA